MSRAPAYADRTLRALELAAAGPVTAVQTADALGVDVRTARRLLERLTASGVLVRLGGRGRRYAPGPRLLALAGVLMVALPAPARAPA